MMDVDRFLARLRNARLSRLDHLAFVLLAFAAVALAGKGWLDAHPGHNPWAPLNLNDPPGWATARKLAALRDDPTQCREVLDRSNVAFDTLEPAGEGACSRPDRTVLSAYPFSPSRPPTTCAIAAGLELWLSRSVALAAEEEFGAGIARIEQLGAYSCRRLYSRTEGPWSEHATGNAIDVAGFVMEDGTRVSVLADWEGEDAEARFLRRVRNGACDVFGTVLSPDYNAAHRDHFHFDQQDRGFGGVCR